MNKSQEQSFNSGHIIEAASFTYMMESNIETWILHNPFVAQNETIKQLVTDATEKLAEAYQEIGQHL